MNDENSHFVDNYHLLAYDSLDSTNEEAKRLAAAGGQHGAVIWANAQTAGKGRGENVWQSREGNLYFSLLLRPDVAYELLPQLSFVTSLALFRTIKTLLSAEADVTIKWPNDLLLGGAKIAGILLETCYCSAGKPWVIVGVGVNVENHPAELNATDLKESGLEIISAKIVLSRFLNMFESLYDEWCEQGFQHIRQQWLAHCAYLHEIISLKCGNENLQGEFVSIDELGHLMLKIAGEVRHMAAGEVHNVRVGAK